MRRIGHGGQQTAEFALVIGIGVIAAIAMQGFARAALQRGLRVASDAMLPPQPSPAKKPDTNAKQELQVVATSRVVEHGSANFRRQTTITESVTGHAVNEVTQVRVIPDPGSR